MSSPPQPEPTPVPDVHFLCLGSGTSHGVPMIGCHCDVCQSDDTRNKRTRCSALITVENLNLLIDTSTDLRLQALKNQVEQVDAVLYTHAHADHLHGIDDLRSFTLMQRATIPCFGDAPTLDLIRRRYPYIFRDPNFTLRWSIPRIDLQEVTDPFHFQNILITPVPLLHGSMPIYGYRVGNLAYLTDCSAIPETSYGLLHNLHTLIIDGLRPRPHHTHFSITQAIEEIQRIQPQQAFLTHLTHDVDHQAVENKLPPTVHLAYDGLKLTAPGA